MNKLAEALAEAIVETPRNSNASRPATTPAGIEEKAGILPNRVNLTTTNNSDDDPGAWDDIT